jgi:hypothetical protein
VSNEFILIYSGGKGGGTLMKHFKGGAAYKSLGTSAWNADHKWQTME